MAGPTLTDEWLAVIKYAADASRAAARDIVRPIHLSVGTLAHLAGPSTQEAVFAFATNISRHFQDGANTLLDAADAADNLAREIARAQRLAPRWSQSRMLSLDAGLRERLKRCYSWAQSNLSGREGDWLSAVVDSVVRRTGAQLTYPTLRLPTATIQAAMEAKDPSPIGAFANDLRAVSDAMIVVFPAAASEPGPRRKAGRPAEDPEIKALANWASKSGYNADQIARAARGWQLELRRYSPSTADPSQTTSEVAKLTEWSRALERKGVPRAKRNLMAEADRILRANPDGITSEQLRKKLHPVRRQTVKDLIDRLITDGKAQRRGQRGRLTPSRGSAPATPK